MVEPVYTPVVGLTRAVFRGLGLRFDLRGEEHVPRSGGAVMAINHVGYLDFTFAGLVARKHGRLVRFMAKKEVFDHKVSGPLMRGMKHIPVDRVGGGAGSYRQAVEALSRGEIVGVFPEATISQSFELKDFKTGAARMAMEAGVPLLPCIVWGSQRVFTKNRPKDLRRGTPITVMAGEPFTPAPGSDPVEVTAELKRRMQALLDDARAGYPGQPRGADDTWWVPASMGGTAPTLEEASVKDAQDVAERAARRATRAPPILAGMALLSRSKKDAPGTGKGAGKGAAKGKAKPPRGARTKQIRAAWTMTRKADPKVLPLTLAAFFGPLLLALAIGLALGPLWLWLPLGFMIGLLATTFVFGRRVQATAFAGVEGQPGAAAAVLNATRGDWRVTPAVGFNRDQEIVHRVVGRPGVILVAEAGVTGVHRGTRNLVATEKKRLARFLSSDVPVYEVLVGDEEGQVPLRGLEKHLMKLPRNIKPKDVNELDRKLKPLGAAMPIPKGPMPTSGRMPRGKMR